MKILHKVLIANYFYKATSVGIVWNYFLEETIKKSCEIQKFAKICSENLSKIYSENGEIPKMGIFAKIANYPKPFTIFVKSSSLDVW